MIVYVKRATLQQDHISTAADVPKKPKRPTLSGSRLVHLSGLSYHPLAEDKSSKRGKSVSSSDCIPKQDPLPKKGHSKHLFLPISTSITTTIIKESMISEMKNSKEARFNNLSPKLVDDG